MKKIISILCTLAMMLTMFTVVASADDNNTLTWKLLSKDADAKTATIELYLNTNQSLNNFSLFFSTADIITKGGSIVLADCTNHVGGNINPVAAQKFITINFANAASPLTGEVKVATVKVTNIDQDFTISKQADSSRTTTVLKAGSSDVTSMFTIADSKITLVDEVVVDDVWTSDEVSSIPEGKKIVAHSENATVTADSRVSITVDGTTKLFGETISAYLSKKGIDLVGEATANVRFALLVNEAANEITFNVQ